MLRVGICDFPSTYAFPPYGYGGIERWLWASAIGAAQAGADVRLIGPSWRAEARARFPTIPVRLEDLTPDASGLAPLRELDLLIVGHEYPSLPSWRRIRDRLSCQVATFQHDPNFRHGQDAFDGLSTRLYCYSAEMMRRYADASPIQALSVQFGLDEEQPPPPGTGRELVWLGRIHPDKAPHLAVMAAERLGLTLTIVAPITDQPYVDTHPGLLGSPHVRWLGELAGDAKTELLRDAAALVYTCAPDYTEAGAAVFGEALRAGVPVAALTWRAGTCAHAALCPDTGTIADLVPGIADEEAADALAQAITDALTLDRRTVQEVGLWRFNATRHFHELATPTSTSAATC